MATDHIVVRGFDASGDWTDAAVTVAITVYGVLGVVELYP
jgi:hypothetical protein